VRGAGTLSAVAGTRLEAIASNPILIDRFRAF
jgi:hypothetical protein